MIVPYAHTLSPSLLPVQQSKYLYHAFHKLFGLEAILRGELPPVHLPAHQRDFVMRIRTDFDTLDLQQLIDDVTDRVAVEHGACGDLPTEVDPVPFLAYLTTVRG